MFDRRQGTWLLAVLLLEGCGGDATPPPGEPMPAADARVVIAILDSGINPYHAFFHESRPGLESPLYPAGSGPASVTPAVLAEFGIDAEHVITPTRTGRPDADFAADAPQWAAVRPREAYWFRGTNIIAVGRYAPGLANAPDTGPLILPDDDGDTHGVMTTAAALRANPEAIIYFVEHNNDRESTDIGSEDIHNFGFLHPAVDIVSTSYVRTVQPEVKAFFRTFEAVVRRGKLHFSPGMNVLWPTFTQAGAGPWWSIAVAGYAEGETNGRTVSGAFPDFVADDYQDLPAECVYCQDGVGRQIGTSLSSPHAAGIASRVLLEARRALGHRGGIAVSNGLAVMARGADREITNWQLRRALEQAAYVPGMSDWTPDQGAVAFPGDRLPVLDEAPWLEVGWGLMSADPDKGVVAQALAFLGFATPTRAKDPAFCDFQTALIRERHLYWDAVSPAADALIPDYVAGMDVDTGGDAAEPLDEDPFIYCGSALSGSAQ